MLNLAYPNDLGKCDLAHAVSCFLKGDVLAGSTVSATNLQGCMSSPLSNHLPCLCMQVRVVDVSNVQVVLPSATTASTQKPPLLGLELQVSDGTKITCKTDLDSITPRMLALFDRAITVTQVIHLICYHMLQQGL